MSKPDNTIIHPGESAATGSTRAVLASLESTIDQVSKMGQNLVGSIRGYASLIQDEAEASENARRWADRIVYSIDKYQDFIQRLEMLRINSETIPRRTSWAEIVSSVMSSMDSINKKSATIEVHNTAQDEFTQYPELLRGILFQILRNACEAVDIKGSVALHIGEDDPIGGTRAFTVSVEDNGRGFGGVDPAVMLSPFFTTKPNHIGLGLSFVSVAAHAVGASVDMQSGANKTIVKVRLKEQGVHHET